MKRRLQLRVAGRVQGVCFRMYTAELGQQLGLTGWVRNRADGAVEVVAEGENDALLELAGWCRRGPPHARVTHVDEAYGEATGEFPDFSICC